MTGWHKNASFATVSWHLSLPPPSHLEMRVLDVPVRDPFLEGFKHTPPWIRDVEYWEFRLALLQAGGSQEDVAHDAEAVVGGPTVVIPADGAAVAAAESLAVPQQPVEPQAELQVLDALCPVLHSVLFQRIAVRRLQGHDVLLGKTFEAVRLVLGVHQGRQEHGQRQTGQKHRSPPPAPAGGHCPSGSTNFHRFHHRIPLMSACT